MADQLPADQEVPGATDEHARKDKILSTARDRFKYCIDSQSLNRESQIDDLKFFAGSPDNGWQWDPKLLAIRQNDPNGARPCLTVNKLPQHVRQITNEQRQNRPAIKVLPVDSGSDVEVAKMLNGIVRHIEYQSDADTAYDTACESQVVIGEGYWRILTDYIDDTSADQDIFIKAIPETFSVYLDPDRKDPAGADCRYGFIVREMPECDFEAEYPDAEQIDWDEVGRGTAYTNWFSSEEKKVKVAEYFYIEHETSTIQVGDRTRNVRKPIVKWCKLTGTEVLDERVWPGKWIPIVMVIGNETWYEGNSYRSGLIRTTKDSQRIYNFMSSAEAEQIGLANKAPYIGYAGQFENHEDKWKNANTVNYPYLEVEAVDDGTGRPLPLPQRQAPPAASSALANAKLSASDDMKAETGQYNPTLGNNAQSQSGVALAREQKKAEISNFHYIDNLSRSIRHTGRQIIDLIPKIYDTKRIARILGEDGATADQVVIDPAQPVPVQPMIGENGNEIGKIYNPSLGRYDVAVVVGPSYTTQRQEAAQMLVDLAQGATDPVVQISMRYLAVKNMDWAGAQEMADILKKLLPPGIADEIDKNGEMSPEQCKQMVQQMQQATAQKEQQIREAARQLAAEEERIAKEREGLTQLKAQTEKQQSDVTHAAEIAKKDDELRKKDLQLQAASLSEKEASATRATETAKNETASLGEHSQAVIAAIQESSRSIVDAFAQMLQQSNEQLASLISCERRTELEFDENNNPVSSVSRLVPPKAAQRSLQ